MLGVAVVLAGCGYTAPVGRVDRCERPETYNGFEDDDGCADRPPADREHCVWIDVVHIGERIHYDDGGSRIADRSRPIVEAIAATLSANPSVDRVAVVGGRMPTERSGIAEERAADVVRALVELGVASERLQAHGYARAERSVWFVVLRMNGEQVTRELAPWERDCAGSWRAWREGGSAIDCDCLDAAR